jgi:Sodium/hydrogen exchanger family
MYVLHTDFAFLSALFCSFQHHYDFILIAVAMCACLLARACNVFPVAGVVNLVRRGRNQIPYNHQVMMWFSGLRGAIAFSLALEARETLPNGHILLTTTLVIVLFTVLVFGGFTTKMLQLLKISVGVSQHDTTRYTNRFLDFDRRYLKPFFTDRKPLEVCRRCVWCVVCVFNVCMCVSVSMCSMCKPLSVRMCFCVFI